MMLKRQDVLTLLEKLYNDPSVAKAFDITRIDDWSLQISSEHEALSWASPLTHLPKTITILPFYTNVPVVHTSALFFNGFTFVI